MFCFCWVVAGKPCVFFGGRSRLPKIYGSPIPDFFLGGGTPKIVGKTRISGKSFWGRAPKIVGKSRISGEIFLGKDHQDSGKK